MCRGLQELWWAILGSNQWPSVCKTAALPLRQSPMEAYSTLKHPQAFTYNRTPYENAGAPLPFRHERPAMKDQLELLIEFTKDEDPRSRATAIAGLAKLVDPRGFAPVLVALFDPVDEVRVTAATALGVYKDERALEPLISCLSDPCEQVAVNCIWALGQLPGARAARQLVDTASDESAAVAVRTAAVTAIGENVQGEHSALLADGELSVAAQDVLHHLLESDDNELRATVVWTLGHFPHSDRAVDGFIRALTDGYEWVVRYAIEALANAHDARAVEPLQSLLGDEREEISRLAKQTLERLA